MSVVCQCPAAAALTTIPAMSCGENFGQIQKIIFQRLESAAGTPNEIAAADASAKTTWTDLKTETDGTKIVVTPYVEAPTQEGGDPITFGGGNDTLGGAEEIVGRNASTMSFAMRKYPQSIISVMKALQCEVGLGVYLINEHGQIEGKAVKGAGGTITHYRPIPIRSLFVGDKVHGGLETPDSNELRFAFPPNYSDDLAIITPASGFNPLIDL